MGEIINTFHIDWKIMAAQLVNFAIVVLVLWFFAFKPLAKKMAERTEKIDKSLKEASAIEERFKEVEEKSQQLAIKAKKESEKIIQQAGVLAEEQRQQTISKTKDEVAKIVAASKKQIVLEKEKMTQEIKDEIGELVVKAAEKIIKEKLNEKKDWEIINQTVKNVKS